jgi:hypothetical protein
MTNTYKKHLDQFFEKLLYYRHISGRINKVFQKDINVYSTEKAIMHFASALIISDWTGPTDNGWEINFHTGIVAETTKDNYETEIEKISSRQLCLLYAQSFESFERFLKDCLFDRISRDDAIREYAITLLPKDQSLSISREKMPGGNKLFKVLKQAGGESFKNFSSKNNLSIKFKELWTILSEVRHSVTHNESLIKLSLINRSDHHSDIFKYLFNSKNVSDDLLLIELDYKKFDKLIKRFSEFAFQIFKLLSIEEKLEWKNK